MRTHLDWMHWYLNEIIRHRFLSYTFHWRWLMWDIQREIRKYLWHLRRWLKEGG
jgi:hypothetical protein